MSTDRDARGAVDALVTSLAGVVDATLGVGAALARTAAQATSGGRALPEPGESGPIGEIVHYGVTTIGNMAGMMLGGLSTIAQARRVDREPPQASASAAPPPPASPAPTASAQPGLPTVRQGATLRVPLSIENPGPEPMTELRCVCLGVRPLVTGPGRTLDVASVRLQPEMLTIAARDFEKLTVFVDTTAGTATGRYEALIGLGPGVFETILRFDVAPATPSHGTV